MKNEPVVERFTAENGMRLLGVRVITLTLSDHGTFSPDPLTALDQQNHHAAVVEGSRAEAIEFEAGPNGFTLAPGCILTSEMFGDCWRETRFSGAEPTVDVESA